MSKYENYELNDFLQDNDFIQHVFCPTQDSNAYWGDVADNCPSQKGNLERAAQILNSIEFNSPEISSVEIDNLFDDINQHYKVKLRKRRILKISSIAASIVLICISVGVSIKYLAKDPVFESISMVDQVEKIDELSEVKLIMGDSSITFRGDIDIVQHAGEMKVLEKEKGEAYVAKVEKNTAINKLIVPYGKRSSLTLADGSKLWINSGTTITFPADLSTERFVEVDGEIFINVAKNKEIPFHVRTSLLDVKVIGTQFNVSSYSNSESSSVTLAEGRVEISTKKDENKIFLTPGDKLNLTAGGEISVNKVDVYNEISWKDGVLYFEGEKLADVVNRLSRFYNVNISCSEQSQTKRCTGKLVLFDNLEETLNTLSDILDIKYELNNSKIEISTNK